MHDSSFKSFKIPQSICVFLNYLYLVVASFCISVCESGVKSIQYFGIPLYESLNTGVKSFESITS